MISVKLLSIYRFLDEQLCFSQEVIAAAFDMSRPSLYQHKVHGFKNCKIRNYEAALSYLESIQFKISKFLEDEQPDA